MQKKPHRAQHRHSPGCPYSSRQVPVCPVATIATQLLCTCHPATSAFTVSVSVFICLCFCLCLCVCLRLRLRLHTESLSLSLSLSPSPSLYLYVFPMHFPPLDLLSSHLITS